MSASTSPPAAPPPAQAYAEDDKLGPVPTAVADGAPVRGRVLAEVTSAVAAARAAASAEPAVAIHEVRKALRRIRSVVDAVAPALERRAHRGLRRALVEARRTLGPARDRTVAHLALAALPEALAAHARALIAASAAPTSSVDGERDAVAAAIAAADAQAVALAAALPEDLRAGQVARGVARTYRQARTARRKARRSERALHRWRRRTKELIYQLALLDDEGAADLRSRLVDLDEALGHVVDHVLLARFVDEHGAELDGEATGALLAHVHEQLDGGRAEARAASKALFAPRPRKLRRRLRGALRALARPVDA